MADQEFGEFLIKFVRKSFDEANRKSFGANTRADRRRPIIPAMAPGRAWISLRPSISFDSPGPRREGVSRLPQMINAMLRVTLVGIFALALNAAEIPAHGLWVWKTAPVLAGPNAAEALQDFCRSGGVDEVYVSVTTPVEPSLASRVEHLINVLHRSNIRVEALLSSENADEPGKHRDVFLERVRAVLEFNHRHSGKFDGIHLDIEPQQRPENKGAGNLRFLPGLADAYHAARTLADREQLTVDADIQSKLLKGDLAQRRMLLTSLPRLTLMLYELSSPSDGKSTPEKLEKLRNAGREFLDMAYQGLGGQNLAKISIALRTPDYGGLLPSMLQSLDEAFRTNPHYGGWARHSYNDELPER